MKPPRQGVSDIAPPSYVSEREFTAWSQSLDKKLDRVLDHIEQQNNRNLSVEGRLVRIEAEQLNAGKLSAKISGVVGAAVAALIAGIFSLLNAVR